MSPRPLVPAVPWTLLLAACAGPPAPDPATVPAAPAGQAEFADPPSDPPGQEEATDATGSPAPPVERVEGRRLLAVLPPERIPPIDDPRFVPAAEAGANAGEELVVGVVGRDGSARAYPTRHLEPHGVVNDVLDGVPIAVTWCPLAGTPRVYSRALEDAPAGEPLRFEATGQLWNGALVLRDRATGSLWSQPEGRAIRGELAGRRLRHLETSFATWAAWQRLYPATLALAPAGERGGSPFAAATGDPVALFRTELGDDADRLAPGQVVWGVVVDGAAAALPDDRLGTDEVRALAVGGRRLVWVRDPATGGVLVAEARLEGRDRILARLPGVPPTLRLQDVESGATLRFSSLPRLRVDRARWYAWALSYPGTRLLGEASGE